MDDQQRVQKFLDEFISRLARKFRKDLDFVLLFGSAARGEWKRGISDIDLIIQSKSQQKVEEISKEAEKIFWELDKKYDTRFREACSIGDTKDPLKKILRKTRLYVPFEVFGPEDIDWICGKIKKKEILLGAELIAPQSMLFLKMKYEGKVLYGRDIRKIIQVKKTWWEKIKSLLVPFWIALFSTTIALFFPKRALKMADKSVLYSIESFLYFLDKPIGKGVSLTFDEFRKEIKKIAKTKSRIMGAVEVDFLLSFDYRKNTEFVKRAIQIKYNWPREYEKFSRPEILKFCWQSVFFTNTMNWHAILRSEKNRAVLKALIILRTLLLVVLIIGIIYYLNKFI
ncbi:nucleotidyltransferase domain-containing protein [bacterium]|nr:nucleotidyltransferase domain-containing protein [bacterium]